MVSFAPVVLASALLVLATGALVTVEERPQDKCYEKYVTCCFKYFPCGQAEKSVTVKPRCDFKKCGKVCVPKCHIITKHVPKQVCDSYGKCHNEYVPVKSKECKPKCMDECSQVSAVCPITKVFSSTKFCARLSCGGEEIVGDSTSPESTVLRVGKKVRTLPGRRKVLGVDGLDEIVSGCTTSSCSASAAAAASGSSGVTSSGGIGGSVSSGVSGGVGSGSGAGSSAGTGVGGGYGGSGLGASSGIGSSVGSGVAIGSAGAVSGGSSAY